MNRFLRVILMSLFFTVGAFAKTSGMSETPLDPIGQVDGRIVISKSSFVKVDEEYQMVQETVCEKAVRIDVYDQRGGGHLENILPVADCASVYKGKPAKISVFGHLSFESSGSAGRTRADQKSLNTAVSVHGDAVEIDDDATQFRYSRSGTRDLEQTSFISEVAPNQYMTCGGSSRPVEGSKAKSCYVKNPEAFYVTMEVGE